MVFRYDYHNSKLSNYMDIIECLPIEKTGNQIEWAVNYFHRKQIVYCKHIFHLFHFFPYKIIVFILTLLRPPFCFYFCAITVDIYLRLWYLTSGIDSVLYNNVNEEDSHKTNHDKRNFQCSNSFPFVIHVREAYGI